MGTIFLYGPPGSGKTTIGRLLAGDLGLPFIDLDQAIEARAGVSIPQIMETRGEEFFRDMETSALEDLATEKESVISLGGGALLRPGNRTLAESHGVVVLLCASVEILNQRLEGDGCTRPLLGVDFGESLVSLLKAREEHYTSFPLQVNTSGMSVAESACAIQGALGRYHLSVLGGCDVLIGQVSSLPFKSFIVTDENVAKVHLEGIQRASRSKAVIIPPGEKHKNLETISYLWKAFLDNDLDRESTVIAFGGGVVSDLVGFAASTFMRGIDWVCIPTTLLAMVDASIGGKTGFDLQQGKNLIGTFHSPRRVLSDPSFLLTLADRELRSGLAEVVKHGIIADAGLFALCSNGLDEVKAHLEEVVKRAIAVKVKIVRDDPSEKGARSMLNFGHTFGHALEHASRYELLHGEAVAIGMVAEARLAERLGVASAGSGLSERIQRTLVGLGLPTEIPPGLSPSAILRAMSVDKKKRMNMIRFALPVDIGQVDLVDVGNLDRVLEEK